MQNKLAPKNEIKMKKITKNERNFIMKNLTKLFALALALIMVLGLATTAAAAEGDITISITTSDSGASVDGHTYNVYQIFTGTVATDGKTLTDAAFGANYAPAGQTVDQAMEAISNMSATQAAAALNAARTGDPVAVLNDANDHQTTVAPGYYLIVDVSEDLPEGETSSAFILQVLESTVIKSKHYTVPKTEKKIDDTNDSVDAENEIIWHDSADHDIGDAIPFKLEMTVPAIFNEFVTYGEAYKFVFHDKEEKGLTFQNDAKVYVDGIELTTGFEVVVNPTDGDTFDVVFADMTKIDGIKAGSKVTVVYHSILNESAILGSQGNVNEMYGEYANLHRPEEPGFTPKDTVIAFTYKVVVNKVDENEQPLAGAEFTLEKYDAATQTWVAIKKVETEPGSVFTFKGLDDGNYRLTETKTPDGYNSIEPIEFTVTADHDIEWETQTRLDVLNSLTGDAKTGDIGVEEINEIKFTPIENNEGLTTDVINQSGVLLPETGGIGTTIFYIVGGLLAVGAVILLVTKKRMATAE